MADPATLAEALVAFQKDAPHIAKDSVNPHFKNRYASLDSIMDAVRGPLAAQGLVISQQPTVWSDSASTLGVPALRTVLLHVSGESIERVMLLSADKPGPQAQGSALTYARRYAVLAFLGLVADEDDDGEAAEKKPAERKSQAEAAAGVQGSSSASEEELTAKILAAADILGVKEATAESVAVSKGKRTPADHLMWLGTTLTAAEEAVKQFELQAEVPA